MAKIEKLEVTSYEEFEKHPAPHIRGSNIVNIQVPKPKWAIPEFISKGVTVLAAKPKVGKSTIMMDISLSKAAGTKVLGSIEVEKGIVVYYALEPRLDEIQAEIEIMMQGDPVPDDVVVVPKCPDFGWDGKEYLEAAIKYYCPALVVIDTMGRIKADLPGVKL
jgi:hypothetical protein